MLNDITTTRTTTTTNKTMGWETHIKVTGLLVGFIENSPKIKVPESDNEVVPLFKFSPMAYKEKTLKAHYVRGWRWGGGGD